MQLQPEKTAPSTAEPIFVRARMPPGARRALRWLLRTVFRLVARVEVRGLEHVPEGGGFIVSPNHLSYFDLPLLFTLLGERPGVVLGAHNYRRKRLFRWFLEGAIGVVWVDRSTIGPSTIKAAVQALQEGNVLGLAPEGTRSRVTHALQEGKTGGSEAGLRPRREGRGAALK
jgi:1-acyl-sn-glycerol-3-phosphate acyltransferase